MTNRPYVPGPGPEPQEERSLPSRLEGDIQYTGEAEVESALDNESATLLDLAHLEAREEEARDADFRSLQRLGGKVEALARITTERVHPNKRGELFNGREVMPKGSPDAAGTGTTVMAFFALLATLGHLAYALFF